MENGYIKIYRSMLKWEWYQDTNTKIVFIHLLLNANFEKTRFRGYDVPKGGLVVGRKKLADELGLSEQSVRTALEHLKSTNEITIQSTNRFSIVTLVNWEKYQGYDFKSTNKITNNSTISQPTANQQLTTEEEYKNIRIKEEYIWVQEKFNELCSNLNKCKAITKTRADAIKKLLAAFTDDEIEEVFKKANDNSWLTGKNEMRWKADFDWIIDIDHFVRIQEGRYDDFKQKGKDANQGMKTHNYDFEELEREIQRKE